VNLSSLWSVHIGEGDVVPVEMTRESYEMVCSVSPVTTGATVTIRLDVSRVTAFSLMILI